MDSEASTPLPIRALPKEVVDRIAAGEVVQRPSSVVKELIENSLDAGSTSILVHVESGGLSKLQVVDNGCGIAKQDLGLAATRFATSKLRSTSDFDSLSSFGFRGEALASMSLVARLQIVTRQTNTQTAFLQNYQNGKPQQDKPTPQARTQGTTATVSDLFYNMPHRKKLKESEEYHKILTVVQSYAIQYAGVGFICRKLKNKRQVVDLNSSMLTGVKALQSAVKTETSTQELVDTSTMDVLTNVFGAAIKDHLLKFQSESSETSKYEAQGFVTNPSYSASHATKLVLFINHRWVECTALKKACENVYAQFTKSKALLYLSLQLPGTEVDVNVHPTKKQVTLLHQDDIIESICLSLKELLMSTGHSFATASVAAPIVNPYKKQKREQESSPATALPSSQTLVNKKAAPTAPRPSTMVRTTKAAPAGALEPYLVLKSDAKTTIEHESSCPLSSDNNNIDLSQPGAFAQMKCTCTEVIRKLRQPQVRPPKIVATHVTYKSIRSLRSHLVKKCCPVLKEQFRKEAIYVGTLSDQRSLVQCGVELQLWQHGRLAEIMFQQLVLMRFAGMQPATLGKAIEVQCTIAHTLQLEEQIASELVVSETLEISETNQQLAHQATTCLLDRAALLKDYFAIGIEEKDNRVILTALPVILEGYVPLPAGLPLFLLRLATEVNWTDEKPCFAGVSRELGLYYGQVRASDVQHKIFPSICHVMLPPKDLAKDGTVSTLTVLSTLYKMFERG